MGAGETGWWGGGDGSHQRWEELNQCCFKDKEVWERRGGGVKNGCVREVHGVPTAT